MRCACVDIGSNTTRLLVADCAPAEAAPLQVLCARRSFVGLPECAAGEPVGTARAARLATVVAAHVALAREHGAGRVRIVGTAALRRAPDRDEVVAAVQRACGLPVAVLDPHEEARLAFAGAVHGRELDPDAVVGVADIGGGSSELVLGTPGDGVQWSASVPTGSGVLAAAHLRSDPPSPAELQALAAAAEEALAALRPPEPVAVALAVGGSAASLRRMAGGELDDAALDAALRAVCARPALEVAALHGIHAQRVRLLPAGLLLLRAAAHVLGRPLQVAGGGLREGVVLHEVARSGAG